MKKTDVKLAYIRPGHWTGIFTAKGDETEIDFTEQVEAKKLLMKPFVKSYLRKQQTQFVADIRKVLGGLYPLSPDL